VASSSRGRVRERLEQELQTAGYQKLLRDLYLKEPFLRQFDKWAHVLVFMRQGTSQDVGKDKILRPIFQAHGEDQDPRWREILLAVFWPGLESIHWRKRRWDPDEEELWVNILWAFHKTICSIDVLKRTNRLVQKVINDTFHNLYAEYRREWNWMNRKAPVNLHEIDERMIGDKNIDFPLIELRETKEAEIKRIQKHLSEGRINEADFLLLVGTRIYGKSIVDYAREVGLDYEVVKKRRQRAEASIRQFESKRF